MRMSMPALVDSALKLFYPYMKRQILDRYFKFYCYPTHLLLYSTRYSVRERERVRSLLYTPLRGFSVIPFLSYKEIINEILPRPGGKDSVMMSSSLLLVPPAVGCINEAGTHPISPSQSTSHQPAIKSTTRQVLNWLFTFLGRAG